jgi:hypothetical protein
LTGILCGLALRVVEVSWDSDDGILYFLAKVSLSSLLHLAKNETANLGWRVLIDVSLVVMLIILLKY